MEIRKETLKQFYERTRQQVPAELLNHTEGAHFNVKRRSSIRRVAPYNRRDFYKICLVTGTGIHLCYDKETLIEQPAILFSNPDTPLSYQSLSEGQGGFYCLFNDAFISNSLKYEIKFESPLFNDALPGLFMLDDEQLARFSKYFMEMEELLQGTYKFKFDLIRNVLQTLIHESIMLQQPGTLKSISPADRVVSRFFSSLDQQFPVDSPSNPLQLMTPSDFAEQLNVHVNYLNSLVKHSTGKTTSTIIHERVIAEAKILLINTDWDVAEIAYSLGFEYPSHFNKYFKKYTYTTPLLFRENIVTLAIA